MHWRGGRVLVHCTRRYREFPYIIYYRKYALQGLSKLVEHVLCLLSLFAALDFDCCFVFLALIADLSIVVLSKAALDAQDGV